MSTEIKKITAIIPCFNEARGIADVITSFPVKDLAAHGYTLEIIVVDNNSTDHTADIARSLGATVLHEPKKGKGNAMRLGFKSVSSDTDYVVMLDGDATYRPEEILRIVEPLRSGFCNVIIGSRLGGKITKGSMAAFNRAGNWMYSMLVRSFYRANVTDVLTGYFAWTRDAIMRLHPHLVSQGFAIEMEMVTKMALLGEEIYSVPITYHSRAGHSNLSPIWDGFKILWMFTKNLFWKPAKKKTMRIAFVSDVVMPYHMGGKERRLYEISKRLVSDDHEVHIYTMKQWEGPNTIRHKGVYLHAICAYHPLYTGDRRSIKEAIIFGLATFKLLFARFDVLDVDHIPFFPLFSARIVTWLRGKKMYATWHEVWGRAYWKQYLGFFGGFFGHIVEQISFRMPDVFIANSLHTSKRLRDAGITKEIRTIPLGVDLQGIYDAQIGENTSDVIFVGRLLNHKNADLLVRAIAIVKETYKDVTCNIVGSGPERATLDRIISDLALEKNIRMLDNVSEQNALYGLMKASKMLVLPSVREGFGLVVIEANAAGLPVITTNHRDNAAKDLIVEGTNGFLSEPTPEHLAIKIVQILETHAILEPKHGIEQYDWRTVVESMKKSFALGS